MSNPFTIAMAYKLIPRLRFQEGMTRYCLSRAEPKPLEEVFFHVLQEDYTVALSYLQAASKRFRTTYLEPMEINYIEISCSCGKKLGCNTQSNYDEVF